METLNVDAVNGLFELGGACAAAFNVRRILLDKAARGVSYVATSWFTLWGAWNLHYYTHVQHSLSWWAAAVLCAANFSYAFLLWRYRRKS